MSRNIKLLRRSCLVLLFGGLIGCNPLSYLGFALPAATQIDQLEKQTPNSPIYLEGQAGDRAPFLGSGAYQLQDSTGTVWVLTQGQLPRPGTQVRIKGKVQYQSIPVGTRELGEFYILELEQLAAQPPTQAPAQPTDDLFLPHKQYGK